MIAGEEVLVDVGRGIASYDQNRQPRRPTNRWSPASGSNCTHCRPISLLPWPDEAFE
jgi:hypothetical protein